MKNRRIGWKNIQIINYYDVIEYCVPVSIALDSRSESQIMKTRIFPISLNMLVNKNKMKVRRFRNHTVPKFVST